MSRVEKSQVRNRLELIPALRKRVRPYRVIPFDETDQREF